MSNDDTNTPCAGGCGVTSKWAQVTAALEKVVQASSTTVNWGLKYFSDDGACGATASPAVVIGPNNASAIATSINATAPSGSTPICAAVISGAAHLAALPDSNPKFMLLVTDANSDCLNCPDSGQMALATAASQGFRTFVLGVGNVSGSALILDQLAEAGGEARTGAATVYYGTSDEAALESALTTIAACRP